MSQYLSTIIEYSQQLGLDIISQDKEEELVIVSNEENGICNMVIDCEYPILIMEQLIYEINTSTKEHFLRLLQMNRQLIHGSFIIDEKAQHVIFRDTLQIENLDFNEFEGSLNALSLGLAEFASELIELNKIS